MPITQHFGRCSRAVAGNNPPHMDDLRLDAVAARVVAWHNRHPLARRIGPAQVQAVGYVALPFVDIAAVPGDATGAAAAAPAVPDGGSLRERAILRARQPAAAGAVPPEPDGRPPAPMPRGARRLRAAFSEDFIQPWSPAQVARWARRHGRELRAAPGDGPVREIVLDAARAGAHAAVVRLYLATAAVEVGGRRGRVLLSAGSHPALLGRRLWSGLRLGGVAAALVLIALATLGLPAMVAWLQPARDAAVPLAAPAASGVTHAGGPASAAAVAAVVAAVPSAVPAATPTPATTASAPGQPAGATAVARVLPAALPAGSNGAPLATSAAATEPVAALPGPPVATAASATTAAAASNRATAQAGVASTARPAPAPAAAAVPAMPALAAVEQAATAPQVGSVAASSVPSRIVRPELVPPLDPAARAAARAALAAARASAPTAPAAPAAPAMPVAPAQAAAPARPGAIAGPAVPAASVASAATAFALTTRLLRTRAESEQLQIALRSLLANQGTGGAAVQVELVAVGDDWRVVCWPFARRDDAERARALLASRGLRVETIAF